MAAKKASKGLLIYYTELKKMNSAFNYIQPLS